MKTKGWFSFLSVPILKFIEEKNVILLGIHVNAGSHCDILVKNPGRAQGEEEGNRNKVNLCSLHLAFTRK